MGRYCHLETVQCVVITPVLELLPDTAADLEVMIGRHCYITLIEKDMDVATQEETVTDVVLPSF